MEPAKAWAISFVRETLNIGAMELIPGEGRKLKSGRMSPYFFNAGLFNKGAHSSLLSKAYIGAIVALDWRMKFDVVFGPAYKGIPLAVSITTRLYEEYRSDVGWAFNRKEAKDHGEGGTIVGCSVKNKGVLIVDDVMTTGTSSGEAVDIVVANGGIPVGCVIAFDRQERGAENELSAVQEFEKNYRIPVRAAATLSDLIDVLKEGTTKGRMPETLRNILAYQARYGAKYE